MRRVEKVLTNVTSMDATSSNAFDIKGASKVTLFCKRSSHSSGSSVFSATVGVGTDYAAYNKWISNVTNTNEQSETRVASLTLSADGCGFLSMSPEDAFEFIKVTVDSATDGVADAWLLIDYED
jgi:hypothetical protein